MTQHRLKVDPPYFGALESGEKKFEVRRNDRGFQTGDHLTLVDASAGCSCGATFCDRPAKTIEAVITYVYSGDPRFGGHGGLQPGYVVLGIRLLTTRTEASCPSCGHDLSNECPDCRERGDGS